ncbi:MAG: flagellar assembly protein FliH [Gammaproteobacteria bacterium]|nr:MAG: flagellar assembly protein FliH [Gammaproteobacteria bacterium]RKZ98586.1 MAG: flagellar assembly protein FliH [Gammaproteobacteria bacterium]
MTSSDELVSAQANEVTSEELADYQRWQAPHVVAVTNVENAFLTVEGIESLQNEAKQEGFKAGFDEGRKAGLEAGQADIIQQLDYLKQIMVSLNTPLNDLDQQIENDLITLVTTVARQIVRRELKADPEHVIGAIRAAISVLPINDRKIKIYLNPQDTELVKNGLSLDDDGASWQWLEDPVLTRGGCRLETADTMVDATVEARLESVINKLLGGNRSDDSTD